MSRVVRFHSLGGPEVLQIDDIQVPAPQAGEVRIAVKAIGLNRAEAMFRAGQYLEAAVLPSMIGYEAAGTVDAIGPGVTGFQVGDRVSTIPGFSMTQYGMYGELVNAPAHAVTQLPEQIDWIHGAAIWMPFLTAWGALIHIAQTQPGDFVLIPAASSSVGLAAIQICRMVGAHPIALTRSGTKVDELRAHAAEHVVMTEQSDPLQEIRRITGKQGARVVFDPVGGPMINVLAEAMSPGGILFQYGALSGEATPLPLLPLLSKGLTIRGYTLFELTSRADTLEPGKQFVLNGLQQGALRPVVSETFPFEEIVAAHRYLESNQQFGKIVVTVNEQQ